MDKGSYGIPHAIHELPLTAGDLCVAMALFKVQDDFVRKSMNYGGWFFATTAFLSKNAKRHKSTIKRSTQRLKFLGLIDYRRGSWFGRRATQYRICIDPVAYAPGGRIHLGYIQRLKPVTKSNARTNIKTSNYE